MSSMEALKNGQMFYVMKTCLICLEFPTFYPTPKLLLSLQTVFHLPFSWIICVRKCCDARQCGVAQMHHSILHADRNSEE